MADPVVHLQAVDEIESSTGAPLDPSNKEGWAQLQQRVVVGMLCPVHPSVQEAVLRGVGDANTTLYAGHREEQWTLRLQEAQRDGHPQHGACLTPLKRGSRICLGHEPTRLAAQYKDQLRKLKQDAVDAMDNVRRRDHLEDIVVDPSQLSQKGTKL